MPFGSEFQQRTLVLLLSQPVTRTRVWIEKWGALLGVLLLLAFVHYVTLRNETVAERLDGRVYVFLVLMACSGPTWTLVAGSTIGGAVFSLASLMLVEISASLAVGYLTGQDVGMFANHPAAVVMRAAYAGLKLWLGWRMFARYEVGRHRDDSDIAWLGPLRGFEILRSRPQGAVWNLVRKELRLQQPTLLIAGVFTVCWFAALAVFALSSERPQIVDGALTALIGSYIPLSLVVAATISVGEEASLGVHAWHLTYPVAPALHWSIKLGVATALVALLGLGLPLGLVALAPFAAPLPAGALQLPSFSRLLLLAACVLLIGFWASTLVRHTVRAAVTTGVALGVFALVTAVGVWIGTRIAIGTQLLTSVMVQLQLPPEALHLRGLTYRRLEWLTAVAALFVGGTLALRQSLAAFRTARIDRARIIRYSVQLAIVAMLVAFFPTALIKATLDQYRSQPVRELEAALQHVSSASISSSGAVPAAVSSRELEATGLLSEHTRRWLAGSRISLHRSALRTQGGHAVTYVVARVSFPNGRESQMMYSVPVTQSRPPGSQP